MKKILSLVISMVLVLSCTITAFAAESYKITIENDAEGHTYEAYQIFSGDISKNEKGEKVLSNVKWGNGQTDNEVGSDASSVAETLTDSNIENFIKGITLSSTPAGTTSTKTADNTYVIDGLAPGYYLVKDKDASLDGKDDAYTKYIIKVVGDATAVAKSSKPTVDKEVKDENADAEEGAENGWGETADHAINESFQFKLTANIPNDPNMDAYKTYKLVFNDTMSEGVTFESIASVKVNGTEISADKYACTATAGQAGGSWSLTIEDLKVIIDDIKGATIEVVYNAHLNEKAAIGNVAENKNDVDLEYSNNPNADGTGKTEKDTVWVFTYEMDNTKIDGETKDPLAGAGFRLYDAEGAEVALIFDETMGAYRPVKDGEEGVEMFSAEGTGIFNIKGLDAGTYTLKETTVPEGYNKCNDISVVITAQHSENNDGASAVTNITMTQNGKTASAITIENNKGATLPETGGFGTTIFYVLGGVLVVGAAVVIISRRRMAVENN